MKTTDDRRFEIVRIRRATPATERVRWRAAEPRGTREPAPLPSAVLLWTAL